MPWYYFEHKDEKPTDCTLSQIFEVERSMSDPPLQACPVCHAPVSRVFTAINIHAPIPDSKLRNTGFSKLVRRDNGVYENVSAQDNEQKIINFNQQL